MHALCRARGCSVAQLLYRRRLRCVFTVLALKVFCIISINKHSQITLLEQNNNNNNNKKVFSLIVGFAGYLTRTAKKDLTKETPESYQNYLTALFATIQMAQISEVEVKSRKARAKEGAKLQLSCPFMSSYLNPEKRGERQTRIAAAAIGD